MGKILDGRLLSWSEIVSVKSILKTNVINDLILIFEKYFKRKNHSFLWGDEVSRNFLKNKG